MKRRVSGLRGKCWYDQAIGFRFISPREVSEELETRGAIETRALSSSRIARTLPGNSCHGARAPAPTKQ